MSLYEVADYRLDPPEPHEDYCSCDDCHSFHRDEGIQMFAVDCRRCADELEADQAAGIRCEHGELIPYVTDPRDRVPSILTDIECLECQVDYGPSVYDWTRILEREAA